MNLLKKLILYSGVGLTLLSGCEEKDPLEEFNEPISSKVEILGKEDLNEISTLLPNSINFSEVQNFSVGDYLVSGISEKTPYGILREVTSISNDRKTVHTKNSNLEEVILEGEINYSKNLSMNDVPASSKLKSSPDGYNFSYSVNEIIFDLDGNSLTTNDQARIIGNIDFNLGFELETKFNRGVEHFYFGTNFYGRSDLRLESEIDINRRKEISFYTQKFNPFTIPGPLGIPIVVVPEIELVAGLEGNVEGNLESRVAVGINGEAGLEYLKGNWSILEEFDKSFDYTSPRGQISADVKVHAGPKLNFLVYGLSGPFTQVNDYLKFDLNSQRTPVWILSAGVEGKIGVEMGVFSKKINNIEKTVFDFENVLAEGGEQGNTAPDAYFVVQPYEGDTKTEFTFNASGTIDKETPDEELYFRWDFEGDGEWDTNWEKGDFFRKKVYSTPGSYFPEMEVIDPQGLTDKTYGGITVKEAGGGGGSLDSLIIQLGPTKGKDASITRIVMEDCSENYAGSGTSEELEVYYQPHPGCREFNDEILIEFPLSSIPNNSEIVSAKMELYGSAFSNYISEEPVFSFYKLLEDWQENSVSWENKPKGELIMSKEMIENPKDSRWYPVDLTSVVKGWNKGDPNYGLLIKSKSDQSGGVFYSKENSSSDKRPKLKIYYNK